MIKINDITNDSLKQIAQSVQYYLSYINTVTILTRQIEESTIRYPISDYVERRINVSDAEFEHTMEGFPSKKNDFFFEIPEDKHFVFEFKYVKGPSEKRKKINYQLDFQLYFNDLVRLAYLNKEYKYRSFFLIAGASYDFLTFLVRDGMNEPPKIGEIENNTRMPKGRFSDYLLSFDTSEEEPKRLFDASQLYHKTKDLKTIYDKPNKTIKKKEYFYKNFLKKYTNDEIIFPPKYYGIETTLVALLNDETDKQSVGIWEVNYKSK